MRWFEFMARPTGLYIPIVAVALWAPFACGSNLQVLIQGRSTKIKTTMRWFEFMARPTGFEPVTCRLEI